MFFVKCLRSKTELGQAVIYNNCSNERSKDTGCGINAIWFEETEENIQFLK
jgi:hypothetical protein